MFVKIATMKRTKYKSKETHSGHTETYLKSRFNHFTLQMETSKVVFNGPTPGLFLFIFVLFKHSFYRKKLYAWHEGHCYNFAPKSAIVHLNPLILDHRPYRPGRAEGRELEHHVHAFDVGHSGKKGSPLQLQEVLVQVSEVRRCNRIW